MCDSKALVMGAKLSPAAGGTTCPAGKRAGSSHDPAALWYFVQGIWALRAYRLRPVKIDRTRPSILVLL